MVTKFPKRDQMTDNPELISDHVAGMGAASTRPGNPGLNL